MYALGLLYVYFLCVCIWIYVCIYMYGCICTFVCKCALFSKWIFYSLLFPSVFLSFFQITEYILLIMYVLNYVLRGSVHKWFTSTSTFFQSSCEIMCIFFTYHLLHLLLIMLMIDYCIYAHISIWRWKFFVCLNDNDVHKPDTYYYTHLNGYAHVHIGSIK